MLVFPKIRCQFVQLVRVHGAPLPVQLVGANGNPVVSFHGISIAKSCMLIQCFKKCPSTLPRSALDSMNVKVTLMRNAGRWLTWNQKPREFSGQLLSFRVARDEAVVEAIGVADGPELYDPKIKSITGNELTIVGLEKVERAWVLQEWKCEIRRVTA